MNPLLTPILLLIVAGMIIMNILAIYNILGEKDSGKNIFMLFVRIFALAVYLRAAAFLVYGA